MLSAILPIITVVLIVLATLAWRDLDKLGMVPALFSSAFAVLFGLFSIAKFEDSNRGNLAGSYKLRKLDVYSVISCVPADPANNSNYPIAVMKAQRDSAVVALYLTQGSSCPASKTVQVSAGGALIPITLGETPADSSSRRR